MNTRLLPVLAGLLLLAGDAFAQQGFHIFTGRVWRDYNANGIRDINEMNLGVSSPTIELRDAGSNALVQSATPNANGDYAISVFATAPRVYRLRIVFHSSSFALTPLHAGGNAALDSDFHPSGANAGYTDPLFGVANFAYPSIDAGLDPIDIFIGNFTWLDFDGDGVQDAGEPGLRGIDVQLWSVDRSVQYASARSGANGSYSIAAPGYGSFRLHFPRPPGADHSPKNAGSNGSLDSDVIPSGVDAGWTDVLDLSPNLLATNLIDAGYRFDNPAEVALEYASVPTLVQPGTLVGWSLWVREGIHRNVGSARIRADIPAGMTEFSWQCTAQGGATCPSSGSGALDVTRVLQADAALRFDFNARVGQPSSFTLVASADVASPQIDVQLDNNLVQSTLRNDRLFRGSFDPGG